MSEEDGSQKRLTQSTQKTLNTIQQTEQKIQTFITQMERLERQGEIGGQEKVRLEIARDLAKALSALREQVVKTGDAKASYDQMKKEVNSWGAGAKYALQNVFAAIMPRVTTDDVKEQAERQFMALEDAGASISGVELSLNRVVSSIDEMANSLIKGDMEGFSKATTNYESAVKTLMNCIDDIEYKVNELKEQRANFEGASKVAKDFFIDVATVVTTASALNAVAKIGKVEKLMNVAKEEAKMGKYWYQTLAGIFTETLPKVVEASVFMVGGYAKNGKISKEDAALIIACAFIPYMGAELHVPKESITFGESVQRMLKSVEKGKKTMMEVVNYVRKSAPTDIRSLAKLLADESGGILKRDRTKIMAFAKELYSRVGRELENIRLFIETKDKSELYRILEGYIKNAVETVTGIMSKYSSLSKGELMEGVEVGVGILDKGKMWFLNNLSKELGDVGLALYLKAVASNAKKYGVELIATGADEIVVISVKGGAKGIEQFHKAVVKSIKKDIAKLKKGVGDTTAFKYFEDALTSVSLHADDAILKAVDDKVLMASSHAPTEFHTLSTFLSRTESGALLKEMRKEYAQILGNFTHLSGEALPVMEKGDGVFIARLGFSGKTTEALNAVGNIAGKGSAQALRKNGVGPSLLNLLGHSSADYFSSTYARAIKKAFEEAGYVVEVGQAGAPLSISYTLKEVGKVPTEVLEKVGKRAEQIFIETVKKEHGELGLTGVKSVMGGNKKTAEEVLFRDITRGMMDGLDEKAVKSSIAFLHTEQKHTLTLEVREFLENKLGKAFMTNEPDDIYRSLNNIPNWVRQPEDIITYLEHTGFSDDAIRHTMESLSGVFR